MSSPIIWIIIPALLGVILFFFRWYYRLTVTIGTFVTLLLAGIAWQLPINEAIKLSPGEQRYREFLQHLNRTP